MTSCGWRGLAIEPVSYVFKTLCRNYARWPRVTPLRGAVADKAGVASITLGGGETNKLLKDGSKGSKHGRNESVNVFDLRSVWDEFGKALAATASESASPSDAPAVGVVAAGIAAGVTAGVAAAGGELQGKQQGERSRRRREQQRARHPPSVSRGPDLLVIDAEGAEPRILGVPSREGDPPRDLPTPLPWMILFEHSHLRARDQRAIHATLSRQGYSHITDLKNRDPRGVHMPPANRLYARTAKRGAVAAGGRGGGGREGGGGRGAID